MMLCAVQVYSVMMKQCGGQIKSREDLSKLMQELKVWRLERFWGDERYKLLVRHVIVLLFSLCIQHREQRSQCRQCTIHSLR